MRFDDKYLQNTAEKAVRALLGSFQKIVSAGARDCYMDINLVELSLILDEIEIKATSFNNSGFDEDSGFFYNPKTKLFILNTDPIRVIFNSLAKLRKYQLEPQAQLIRDCVISVTLHECFHVIQNMFEFDRAQIVKEAEGKIGLAKMDVVADSVSARGLAWINGPFDSNGFPTPAAIARSFDFIIDVGYNAFPFDKGDIHKIFRFLSLLFIREQCESGVSKGLLMSEIGQAEFFSVNMDTGAYVIRPLENEGPPLFSRTSRLTAQVLCNLVSEGDFGQLILTMNKILEKS